MQFQKSASRNTLVCVKDEKKKKKKNQNAEHIQR